MQGLVSEAYQSFAQPIFAAFTTPAAITTEADVAEAVWHAANDTSERLHHAAGGGRHCLGQYSMSLCAHPCARLTTNTE
jgi:hypothetical protein